MLVHLNAAAALNRKEAKPDFPFSKQVGGRSTLCFYYLLSQIIQKQDCTNHRILYSVCTRTLIINKGNRENDKMAAYV